MLYEREKDRRSESRLKRLIEQRGCRVELTETTDKTDMKVYCGQRLEFIIELKTRSRLYDTIVVDVSKMSELTTRAMLADATGLFVVCVNGEYMAVPAHRLNWPTRFFQRTKPRGIRGERPDSPDQVFDIPSEHFVRMCL